MTGTPSQIFMSYRRSQREHVLPVVRALEAAGIVVFLDVEAIDPLADFPQHIAKGIAGSHVLLAWWSADYGDSDHCLNEFKLAWQHARRRSSDIGRRVWVLNPETGVDHIAAGELDASNFLAPPAAGDEAAWVKVQLPRLHALLPEGPLADERVVSATPPTHGVPFGNDHFTGRNAELMRIHSHTHPPKIGAAKRDVAVQTHGLGGIGKTELAIQYARQFDSAYPAGIYWLNLASFEPERYPEGSRFEAAQAAWTSALTKTFAETPDLLCDTDGKPLAPATLRGHLARHFGNSEFLWVLDNVPHIQPESLRDTIIAFWRTPGAHGRSLITTRDQAPMSGFAALPLGVLNAEDALRLLAKYRRPAGDSERTAAEALVEKLGCHPQALTLLGRWIAMAVNATPYAHALDDITATGALPRIEKIAQLLVPQLGDKARGIVATFELSIRALDANASELLTLAAVCAPNEAIPRGLLAKAFGDGEREDACTLALEQLLRGSLVTNRACGSAVEIHALMAETALQLLQISQMSHEALVERVAQALLTRTDKPTNPEQREALANDIRQAHQLALQLENNIGICLGLNAANYYRACGNYTQASEVGRYAMETAHRQLGNDQQLKLTAINELALTLWEHGDLVGARKLQESGLETCRSVLGNEHPFTLTFMGNLANTLLAMDESAKAQILQEFVLTIRRYQLGDTHEQTLTAMINLASIFKDQGNLTAARELFELSLTGQRHLFGDAHRNTLIIKCNLAETLKGLGKLADARKLQESVLATHRRVDGDEHPITLTAMSNLAGTLYALGDLDGSQKIHKLVLIARRSLLGEDNSLTLFSKSNLAYTYYGQGDFGIARELQESVLRVRRSLRGEDHRDTLSSMRDLAQTLWAQGELAGARELEEAVLAARLLKAGKTHPDTLAAMSDLAETLVSQDDLAGARKLQETALAGRRNKFGESHQDTLMSMHNLAATLYKQGELAGARELQKAALAGRRGLLGEAHPDTMLSAVLLLIILYHLDDKDDQSTFTTLIHDYLVPQLNTEPTSHRADLQAAREEVKEFLVNIEPTIAASLRNNTPCSP